MITHREFRQLRLREFVDDVVDLVDWQFMDRTWLGEAVGFTEWLRPVDEPDSLGSLSLSCTELPPDVVQDVLARLDLPVRTGMSLSELVAHLGTPLAERRFQQAPDRVSYDFEIGEANRYTVSCTVKHGDGLVYIVVAPMERHG